MANPMQEIRDVLRGYISLWKGWDFTVDTLREKASELLVLVRWRDIFTDYFLFKIDDNGKITIESDLTWREMSGNEYNKTSIIKFLDELTESFVIRISRIQGLKETEVDITRFLRILRADIGKFAYEAYFALKRKEGLWVWEIQKWEKDNDFSSQTFIVKRPLHENPIKFYLELLRGAVLETL